MVDSLSDNDPNSLFFQIIRKRGFSKIELQADLNVLPDESLLANIDTVAERISKAMFTNEPLVIFGHDDPDGITSTYILYQFFNTCGYQKHNYFIPNRNNEPHGIQQGLVDFVSEGGYTLVVTLDNGISSHEGVEKLKHLGCDTIIVDHHLIQPEQLPQALAIINPQLPHCKYPYKALAGVGVTLMLIRYLGRLLGHTVPLSYYFWTAVGSLADKVPMTGLNRVLVRHVIENWDDLQDTSVEFLLRNYSRVEGAMDVFNFIQYTSRLIANGREDNGQHTAMRFLLQVGDAKASLFQSMEAQKKKWESELNRVLAFLDTITAGFDGNAYIYFDDDDVIPYALLGTGATYILGNLGIPTILLKQHNDHIVCEGRCGGDFNMVEAFRSCKNHLKQYGGHAQAAGFTLEPAKYDSFLECYNQFLSENLPYPAVKVVNEPDASLSLEKLNPDNWRGLEMLLPFGQQNPEPRIEVQDVTLEELQQRFALERSNANNIAGRRGRALVNWKTPQSLRILDWQEDHPAF